MEALIVRLPWPPSVNHYYGRAKNGQVFLKEPGRRYRRQAAIEFARLGWPRITDKVRVHLILSPPDRQKRDIDNIRKAVYDAISDRWQGSVRSHRGILPDDGNIIADAAEFISERGGWVEVSIHSARPSSGAA